MGKSKLIILPLRKILFKSSGGIKEKIINYRCYSVLIRRKENLARK